MLTDYLSSFDPQKRYDVVFCYSHEDREQVEQLYLLLENKEELARVLGSEWELRKYRVFFDDWTLVPGEQFQRAYEQAILASQATVVFLGQSALTAFQYQKMRAALSQAIRQHESYSYRVIPVLLPGADEQSIAGTSSFLAEHVHISFSSLDEPRALWQLIAGIEGRALAQLHGAQEADIPCPYPGLDAFDEEHAIYFWGRQEESEQLYEKVQSLPCVIVLGASGSGKSSLLRAGLLPKVRRDGINGKHWRVLYLVPGQDVEQSLIDAITLARFSEPGDSEQREQLDGHIQQQLEVGHSWGSIFSFQFPHERILLVLDQVEELFTRIPQDEEEPYHAYRSRVLRKLQPIDVWLGELSRGEKERVKVICALRSDFHDMCQGLQSLVGALQSPLLLGDLQPHALYDVITKPAHHVGLQLERGLREVIIAEMHGQEGALPLLQQLLLDLYNHRRGRWLSLDYYTSDKCGGVKGALRKHAQDTYDRLTPEQRPIAREIFVRLVSFGTDMKRLMRRRAPRGEFVFEGVSQQTVEDVLALLAGRDSRLIQRDDRYIWVTHEAILQEWQQLRDWVTKEPELKRLRRRFSDDVNKWVDAGKPQKKHVYRDEALREITQWIELKKPTLSVSERAFVQASEALKTKRQRTQLIVSNAIALVGLVLVAFGGYFWRANAQKSDILKSRETTINAQKSKLDAQKNTLDTQKSKLDAQKSELKKLIRESKLVLDRQKTQLDANLRVVRRERINKAYAAFAARFFAEVLGAGTNPLAHRIMAAEGLLALFKEHPRFAKSGLIEPHVASLIDVLFLCSPMGREKCTRSMRRGKRLEVLKRAVSETLARGLYAPPTDSRSTQQLAYYIARTPKRWSRLLTRPQARWVPPFVYALISAMPYNLSCADLLFFVVRRFGFTREIKYIIPPTRMPPLLVRLLFSTLGTAGNYANQMISLAIFRHGKKAKVLVMLRALFQKTTDDHKRLTIAQLLTLAGFRRPSFVSLFRRCATGEIPEARRVFRPALTIRGAIRRLTGVEQTLEDDSRPFYKSSPPGVCVYRLARLCQKEPLACESLAQVLVASGRVKDDARRLFLSKAKNVPAAIKALKTLAQRLEKSHKKLDVDFHPVTLLLRLGHWKKRWIRKFLLLATRQGNPYLWYPLLAIIKTEPSAPTQLLRQLNEKQQLALVSSIGNNFKRLKKQERRNLEQALKKSRRSAKPTNRRTTGAAATTPSKRPSISRYQRYKRFLTMLRRWYRSFLERVLLTAKVGVGAKEKALSLYMKAARDVVVGIWSIDGMALPTKPAARAKPFLAVLQKAQTLTSSASLRTSFARNYEVLQLLAKPAVKQPQPEPRALLRASLQRLAMRADLSPASKLRASFHAKDAALLLDVLKAPKEQYALQIQAVRVLSAFVPTATLRPAAWLGDTYQRVQGLDWRVRGVIAYSLLRARKKLLRGALALFSRMATAKDAYVRRLGFFALQQSGAEGVVVLKQLIQRHDMSAIAYFAARALNGVKVKYPRMIRAFWWALATKAYEAISYDPLSLMLAERRYELVGETPLSRLKRKPSQYEHRAIEAYIKTHMRDLGPLLFGLPRKALVSVSKCQAAWSFRYLQGTKKAPGLRSLRAFLKHPNEVIRLEAATALVSRGAADDSLRRSLHRLLERSKSQRVRVGVLRALSLIPSPETRAVIEKQFRAVLESFFRVEINIKALSNGAVLSFSDDPDRDPEPDRLACSFLATTAIPRPKTTLAWMRSVASKAHKELVEEYRLAEKLQEVIAFSHATFRDGGIPLLLRLFNEVIVILEREASRPHRVSHIWQRAKLWFVSLLMVSEPKVQGALWKWLVTLTDVLARKDPKNIDLVGPVGDNLSNADAWAVRKRFISFLLVRHRFVVAALRVALQRGTFSQKVNARRLLMSLLKFFHKHMPWIKRRIKDEKRPSGVGLRSLFSATLWVVVGQLVQVAKLHQGVLSTTQNKLLVAVAKEYRGLQTPLRKGVVVALSLRQGAFEQIESMWQRCLALFSWLPVASERMITLAKPFLRSSYKPLREDAERIILGVLQKHPRLALRIGLRFSHHRIQMESRAFLSSAKKLLFRRWLLEEQLLEKKQRLAPFQMMFLLERIPKTDSPQDAIRALLFVLKSPHLWGRTIRARAAHVLFHMVRHRRASPAPVVRRLKRLVSQERDKAVIALLNAICDTLSAK